MLKKFERRVKEELERLPYNDIKNIKKISHIVSKISIFIISLLCGLILLVLGLSAYKYYFTIFTQTVVKMIITCFMTGLLVKIDDISDKIISDLDAKAQFNKLKENLSNEEYIQVTYSLITDISDEECRSYCWISQELEHCLKVFEKQEISYYAKLIEEDTIEIILKNKEGECIEKRIIDSDTFLKNYKIPDLENNM